MPARAAQVPERLDLDNFLPYKLLVVTDRVTQLYARRYAREFGITIPESRVLTVVAQFAPLSSREICERTTIAKSRVSVAVARLVAAGLLTRAADAGDGRLLSLALSPSGEGLYRKIVPLALEMEASLVAGLGPSGGAALMRSLSALGHAAETWTAGEPKAKAWTPEEPGKPTPLRPRARSNKQP